MKEKIKLFTRSRAAQVMLCSTILVIVTPLSVLLLRYAAIPIIEKTFVCLIGAITMLVYFAVGLMGIAWLASMTAIVLMCIINLITPLKVQMLKFNFFKKLNTALINELFDFTPDNEDTDTEMKVA